MRVERLSVARSPDTPEHVRLIADIRHRDGTVEEYWFEVAEEFEPVLSTTGNPWLVCLLPLAMASGEPLELRVPVDRLLLEPAGYLMQIWKLWYPDLTVVPLEAPVYDGSVRTEGKAAAFFSGGVDSFYTALRHRPGVAETAVHLDDLLFVRGADIFIDKRDVFHHVREDLDDAASELGMRLVVVATNLRDTRWGERTNWGMLSHGAALAAAALVLEARYRLVMIASSITYRVMIPWGSHPLTDPLYSTAGLRVVYDGGFMSRSGKVRALTEADVAMRHLRVCYRSEAGDNCCRCEKCYRTTAMLAAFDALHRCTTLRSEEFRLERLARLYLPSRTINGIRELESLARQLDKPALARALRRCLRRSRFLHSTLPVVRRFRGTPIVAAVAGRLEGRLLAGAFR